VLREFLAVMDENEAIKAAREFLVSKGALEPRRKRKGNGKDDLTEAQADERDHAERSGKP
jgi:hypothetical protein